MKLKTLFSDNRGATAIEYGLIVALIALAIIGALRSLGGGADGMWTILSDKFTEGISSTD